MEVGALMSEETFQDPLHELRAAIRKADGWEQEYLEKCHNKIVNRCAVEMQ